MENYCDEHVCLSVCMFVCLSVRQDISGTTRAIFANFSVHVAYSRGSVLLRQGDELPRVRGSFGRFSFPLTMCFNAFAAKGIIRLPITSSSRMDDSVAAAFAANGIAGTGVMGMHTAGEVRSTIALLWPLYGIGYAIIFSFCGFFLLSSFFLLLFSSPNHSGRRLDVYHTSTHGVAPVRI